MSWWRFWDGGGADDASSVDYYSEGVELARKERYHEALTSFRLALREEPGDTTVLEQMAVVYTRIGMTDEALKTYRQALEQEPGSPGANYGIAFLLLNRGRDDEARHHLEAFLDSAPGGEDADRHVSYARETLKRLRRQAEEETIDE